METDGMRLKAQRDEEAESLRIRQAGLAAPISPTKALATKRSLGPKGVPAGSGVLKHCMSRPEFLIGLIKSAVNRFVLSGELADVSDALDRLLATVVSEASRGVVHRDPDLLRRASFYTEPACEALKQMDGTLKRCFGKLASLEPPPPGSPNGVRSPTRSGGGSSGSSGGGSGGGSGSATLSVEEWMQAVRQFRIAGPDLSERCALQAWAWSRMMVENGATVRGQRREHALPYEGFLELTCHLACVKGLPDHEEVASAGCADAADFLLRIEEEDPREYERVVKHKASAWALDPPPDLPKRIEHMANVMHAHLFRGLGQKAASAPLSPTGTARQGAGAGKIREAGEKVIAMNAGVGAMKAQKKEATRR
jgi:hypothetical protein